ncbi:MAG: 50S ribosomal protein L2 [Patescibacteria group bacterium]|nr:50S ribosomal protein L2 [Patescibacteria group bacterium]MDD5490194.1 50S ribosomal protein L2 [Patescibacteria group bacterium]
MGIKIYKPTTSGRRHSSVQTFEDITRKEPEKSLIVPLKKKAGRGSWGNISVRHQGGGAKRFYRIVDFKQDRFDMAAKVESIEYDPNRNARIALVQYEDGEKRYIVAPLDLKVGDKVISSRSRTDIKTGNRLPLEYIPIGTMVYNVELTPGKGGQIGRGAGVGIQLLAIEGDFAHLRMPSSEVRMVPKECLASVGQVGNLDYRNIRWGKAGRMRHRGIRPTVRGKAMNPVDHPHGGGEGRNPIGLKHPKTPTGKPALGVKTRKPSRSSNKLIIKRREK